MPAWLPHLAATAHPGGPADNQTQLTPTIPLILPVLSPGGCCGHGKLRIVPPERQFSTRGKFLRVVPGADGPEDRSSHAGWNCLVKGTAAQVLVRNGEGENRLQRGRFQRSEVVVRGP
jgi:hypothetical protein